MKSPNMQSHGDIGIQKPRTVLSKKRGLVDRIMWHADYEVSVSASSILSIVLRLMWNLWMVLYCNFF